MEKDKQFKKTVWVTDEQHRAIKTLAAQTGRSVQVITAEVIEAGLANLYPPLEAA